MSDSTSPATRPSARSWRWWIARLVTPALILAAGLLLIVAMGVAQRLGWITGGEGPGATQTAAGDRVYTCPMHPQIRQPSGGRCPICGMALVAATVSAETDLDKYSVRIESAQRRLANIETVAARREPLSASIQTVGAIAIDESRIATIASYIDGRLERLFADYTGVDVAQGDHLAMIYSPELYAAQVGYVETQKALRQTPTASLASVREAQQLMAANARQRLVELGMTGEQLADLDDSREAKSRLTIYSPIGGTVIEKLAMEGKYVEAGEPIYRIADLSTVWLMLELYPEDAARIRYGQRVDAEMQSLPGEVFTGRVAFIDPRVDVRTRTVGVRVEFLNDDGRLRPGDYASASIHVPIGQQGEVYDSELAGRWISPMHPQIISDSPGTCTICGMDLVPTSLYGYSEIPVEQPASLYVPRSAVLMAGNNSVVYVETEPGRFEIRPVVLGPILQDRVIILGGLREGEEVAAAGNFLIDSQMQLSGKPSLIDPARALAEQQQRKGPLEFRDVRPTRISGQAGQDLEALFASYFRIQRSLAADSRPAEADALELREVATRLATERQFPDNVRGQLAKISQHSQHLHHLDLHEARHDAFRPISHAVVTLATLVRGEDASQSFHHMFCPMVQGGEGDWLQPSDQLRNPYWGSTMLECGRQVGEYAALVGTGR